MTKLLKFLRLPAFERALFLRALVLMAAVKVGLKVFPFRKMRPLVMRFARPARATKNPHPQTLEHIRWAVNAATHPLRATCLPKAITAYIILRRAGHPCELQIGVIQDEQGHFTAHAWVEHQGEVIVGNLKGLKNFTLLPNLWSYYQTG